MAGGYVPAAIRDKTGNKFITYPVNGDGTFAVITPFTFFNYGHIANSDKGQMPSETVLRNEKGQSVGSSYDIDVKFTGILMQTDKATLDQQMFTVNGQTLGAYYRRDGINGKTQEWFWAGGTMSPGATVNSPSGATSNPIDYTGIVNQDAVTISTTTLASIGAYTTSAVTIPAGQGFVLIETANP